MKRSALITALCCVCTLGVHAQYTVSTIPNPRNENAVAFVANPDSILSQGDADEIQAIAERLNAATEVELVTVVLNSIGEADAFDFSLDLFNTWGIGDKEQNRGVMIFFALESRDIRIVTGGGIEGVLPDATCNTIVYDSIIPWLSAGDYGYGLTKGAQTIEEMLTTDAAKAELLLGYHAKQPNAGPWNFLAIIALFIALIAGWKMYRQKHPAPIRDHNDSDSSSNHHSSWGGWSGGGFSGGGFSGGSFGGGVSFGGGAGGKF